MFVFDGAIALMAHMLTASTRALGTCTNWGCKDVLENVLLAVHCLRRVISGTEVGHVQYFKTEKS